MQGNIGNVILNTARVNDGITTNGDIDLSAAKGGSLTLGSAGQHQAEKINVNTGAADFIAADTGTNNGTADHQFGNVTTTGSFTVAGRTDITDGTVSADSVNVENTLEFNSDGKLGNADGTGVDVVFAPGQTDGAIIVHGDADVHVAALTATDSTSNISNNGGTLVIDGAVSVDDGFKLILHDENVGMTTTLEGNDAAALLGQTNTGTLMDADIGTVNVNGSMGDTAVNIVGSGGGTVTGTINFNDMQTIGSGNNLNLSGVDVVFGDKAAGSVIEGGLSSGSLSVGGAATDDSYAFGDVTTIGGIELGVGDITFNGNVGAGDDINLDGSNATFGSGVTSGGNIDLANSNAAFNGTVDSVDDISLDNSTVTFADTVDSGGGITLANGGDATFESGVTSGGDIDLADSNAVFNNAVDSSGSIKLADSDATFVGTVESGNEIVLTDSNAAFSDAVTSGDDIRLDNSTVTFADDVTSGGDISIVVGGDMSFVGSVNSGGGISLIDTNASFDGAVTVGQAGFFVGDDRGGNANVVFNDGSSFGGGALDINAGSTVTIGGANGGTVNMTQNGTINVADGGSLLVDDDSTLVLADDTNVIDVDANGKLQIGNGGSGAKIDMSNGGTLTLDENSDFIVDLGVTGDGTFISLGDDGNGGTNGAIEFDNDGVSSDMTILDYLAGQTDSSLTGNTTFTIDENGNIVYTVEELNASEGVANILDKVGLGSLADSLSDSANQAIVDIALAAQTPGVANNGVTVDADSVAGNLITNYFDSQSTASRAEMQSVTSALVGLDTAKSLEIALATSNNVAARINTRITQNNYARANVNGISGNSDALASAILNSSFGNRFWFGGFGLWEDADERAGDMGYKYRSGGLITGYDHVFGAFTLGGSFAYTGGSYEDKNALSSDSSIDSYAFNLYGTYNHCSGFFASVVGGYTYSDYDMRSLVTNTLWNEADFHADTWSIGTTLGYDLRPAQCLTITPSIGLYYYNSSTNTFRNSVLNNIRADQSAVELPIDVAVNYDIPTANGNLRLSANAGYAYNFDNDGGELGNFGYNGVTGVAVSGVKGRESARHTGNLGAGVNYSAGRFDIGMKYDYYLKADYDAHRVMGTVGISF